MPMSGRLKPAKNTAATAASAARPCRAARPASQDTASPPSTASGGTMNRNWRMPL